MIFQRALHRELASAAGATFTVLFTVCVTWTLIAILGRAAGGRVASGDVVALIAFQSLNYLPTVLILTSFISVLVAVTRSYRDSEMVVWFASGQSLVAWIRPVLVFGLPMVLLVGALSLVVAPWAKMKSAEFIQRFEKREDLKRVAPGQFRESSSSDRVFFVEGSTNGSTVVKNVFVSTNQKEGSSVVVAREGVIEADGKGGQYLVLKNGRRYEGVPGKADFQSMEFERYSMRVATKVPVLGDRRAARRPAHERTAGRENPVHALRTAVAHLGADRLPGADPARHSARLRQSARRQFGQPDPGPADLLHL